MGTKWACFLWALVTFFDFGLHARAAQRTGSITVQPQWCGTSVQGGTVSVQQVGAETEQGFVLTDGLANWKVDASELQNEAWISWLAQRTSQGEIIAPVGENGVLFEDLRPGIYLVRNREPAHEYSAFLPFLMTLPSDGNWDLAVKPKLISSGESPRTGDRPAPIIAAMGIGLSAAVLMVLVDEHKK